VRNITDEGEMSAFGLPGVTGVLVLHVPAESALARAGLEKNDVILSINGRATPDTEALQRETSTRPASSRLTIGVSRDQRQIFLSLSPPSAP
jgi:S1-C subfamily serine protease